MAVSRGADGMCSITPRRILCYIPPNDHTINYQLESVPSFEFTPLAKATLGIK